MVAKPHNMLSCLKTLLLLTIIPVAAKEVNRPLNVADMLSVVRLLETALEIVAVLTLLNKPLVIPLTPLLLDIKF